MLRITDSTNSSGAFESAKCSSSSRSSNETRGKAGGLGSSYGICSCRPADCRIGGNMDAMREATAQPPCVCEREKGYVQSGMRPSTTKGERDEGSDGRLCSARRRRDRPFHSVAPPAQPATCCFSLPARSLACACFNRCRSRFVSVLRLRTPREDSSSR